jgi:hypothetical protein
VKSLVKEFDKSLDFEGSHLRDVTLEDALSHQTGIAGEDKIHEDINQAVNNVFIHVRGCTNLASKRSKKYFFRKIKIQLKISICSYFRTVVSFFQKYSAQSHKKIIIPLISELFLQKVAEHWLDIMMI